MLVSDYLKQKNKILRDYIGLQFDLVPEDQIEEIKQLPLNKDGASASCPYCVAAGAVYRSTAIPNCSECIMFKSNNICEKFGSTWSNYKDFCNSNNIKMHYIEGSKAYQPMLELVSQYNYELANNINTNDIGELQ